LHYADLAVAPVWNAELGAYVLKSLTPNDCINWQSWPLDSTTSLTRTVHLPSRHVSPLLLLDCKSERLSPPAFMVAGHGAAYVLPDTSLLSAPAPGSLGAHLTSAHLRDPLAALVGQLRNILGLESPPNVLSLPYYAAGAPLWQLRTMQVPLFLHVLGGSAHISHFVHLSWRDSPCGVLCVCREVGLGCRTREQEDCARRTAFMLPWCSHAQNPSHRTPARTPHTHTSKHTTHT